MPGPIDMLPWWAQTTQAGDPFSGPQPFQPGPGPGYGPVGMPGGGGGGYDLGMVPDVGPQEQIPEGFWQRIAQAQGAGQQPFSFDVGVRPTGLEALLGGLAAFGNTKAALAGKGISDVEARNKRSREFASGLAKHRWEKSKFEQEQATKRAEAAANRGLRSDLAAASRLRTDRGLDIRQQVADKPGALTSALTPEQAALMWGLVQQGGAFPPLGRGGITSPGGQAILNAGLQSGGGKTPTEIGTGLAGARATQQANTGALKSIETSLAQQTAFANKLKLNTDKLRSTATKIVQLGPRFFNGPVRAAVGQLGSADQAAFEAAMLPVQKESSRLLTAGPALGGQLTNEATRDLKAIIGGDFNAAQLESVLGVLENDANNSIITYTKERDALRGSVGGKGAAADSTGGGAARVRVIGPNNETGTIPAGSALPSGWRKAS